METQDRHIELDRQTQTKVSQETFCWKGAAITLVWCFQHPGSRCVWRVTGLSDHFLVSSHRELSERKGRARPSLFLFLQQCWEEGLCQSLALTLGFTPLCGWNEIQWPGPSYKKCHGWCYKATKLMAALLPKQMGIAKFRLVWELSFCSLSPGTAALVVNVPGEWDDWNMKTLSLTESHTVLLHLYCLWKIGLEVVYKRSSEIYTIWSVL